MSGLSEYERQLNKWKVYEKVTSTKSKQVERETVWIQELCSDRGSSSFPPRERLNKFLAQCAGYDIELVISLLVDKSQDRIWQARAKSFAVLLALLGSSRKEEICEILLDFESELNCATQDEKTTVQKRAQKVCEFVRLFKADHKIETTTRRRNGSRAAFLSRQQETPGEVNAQDESHQRMERRSLEEEEGEEDDEEEEDEEEEEEEDDDEDDEEDDEEEEDEDEDEAMGREVEKQKRRRRPRSPKAPPLLASFAASASDQASLSRQDLAALSVSPSVGGFMAPGSVLEAPADTPILQEGSASVSSPFSFLTPPTLGNEGATITHAQTQGRRHRLGSGVSAFSFLHQGDSSSPFSSSSPLVGTPATTGRSAVDEGQNVSQNHRQGTGASDSSNGAEQQRNAFGAGQGGVVVDSQCASLLPSARSAQTQVPREVNFEPVQTTATAISDAFETLLNEEDQCSREGEPSSPPGTSAGDGSFRRGQREDEEETPEHSLYGLFLPSEPWREVFVDIEVPPGPLGIVLDREIRDKAVINRFVSIEGGRQSLLQMHPAIKEGMELVKVNEKGTKVISFDLQDLVLAEIGPILASTASRPRTLVFRKVLGSQYRPHPANFAVAQGGQSSEKEKEAEPSHLNQQPYLHQHQQQQPHQPLALGETQKLDERHVGQVAQANFPPHHPETHCHREKRRDHQAGLPPLPVGATSGGALREGSFPAPSDAEAIEVSVPNRLGSPRSGRSQGAADLGLSLAVEGPEDEAPFQSSPLRSAFSFLEQTKGPRRVEKVGGREVVRELSQDGNKDYTASGNSGGGFVDSVEDREAQTELHQTLSSSRVSKSSYGDSGRDKETQSGPHHALGKGSASSSHSSNDFFAGLGLRNAAEIHQTGGVFSGGPRAPEGIPTGTCRGGSDYESSTKPPEGHGGAKEAAQDDDEEEEEDEADSTPFFLKNISKTSPPEFVPRQSDDVSNVDNRLKELEDQLTKYEEEFAKVSASALSQHPGNAFLALSHAQNRIAQINGLVDRLEMEYIDAVHIPQDHPQASSLKAKRKALVQRVEQFSERLRRGAADIGRRAEEAKISAVDRQGYGNSAEGQVEREPEVDKEEEEGQEERDSSESPTSRGSGGVSAFSFIS